MKGEDFAAWLSAIGRTSPLTTIFVQLLFEIQELCYNFPSHRIDAAPCAAAGQEKEGMSAGDVSRTTSEAS